MASGVLLHKERDGERFVTSTLSSSVFFHRRTKGGRGWGAAPASSYWPDVPDEEDDAEDPGGADGAPVDAGCNELELIGYGGCSRQLRQLGGGRYARQYARSWLSVTILSPFLRSLASRTCL